MSSIVNSQVEPIQQLVAPSGVNIATNSSPSLSPIANSIVADVSNPGQLYVGNGTSWIAAPLSISTLVNSITFTLSGQPSLTNCNLALTTVTVGTTVFKLFSLNINQSITATGFGPYSCPNGTIPVAYRPAISTAVSAVINNGGTLVVSTLQINTNGSMTLTSTATSGTVTFATVSGVYQ